MLASKRASLWWLFQRLVFFILTFSAGLCVAQQANVYARPQPTKIVEARRDFKDNRVRPHSKKDDCRGSGGVGMSPLWLKVNFIGPDVARVGQEFTADIEIHNGSNSPIDIPVAPSLGEVEPLDADRNYSWTTIRFSLDGIVGQEPWQYTAGGAVLYGSKETGTILRLNPSEWIEVRFLGNFRNYRYRIQNDDKIAESHIPVGAQLKLTLRPRLFESGQINYYDARTRQETVKCGKTAQGAGEYAHILLIN